MLRVTDRTLLALLLAGALLFLASTQYAMAQTRIGPVPVQEKSQETFNQLLGEERIRQRLEWIREQEPQTIAEQIRLTEIPAPPFMEDNRAAYLLEQMQSRGLTETRIDQEGNVIGRWSGTGDGPMLVLSAHIDTVFPADTDVTVREREGRYHAPGISDDGRGLTVLLTVIEALTGSGLQTTGDIRFVGTVGEEGRGDLRGVKALFEAHDDIDGFVSIDSSGLNSITTGATGSRRFEIRFSGPGGHSFGAFGMASAIHAMGRAITRIGDLEVPEEPKTTFTVGTVSGGTSVNSIAGDAVLALDMRSNAPEQLMALEERVKEVVREAVREENRRWDRPGEIDVEFVLIGDRPAGQTPSDHPLVQSTALAFNAAGSMLETLRRSSTDSNVPMSLGIPAVTIGGGGRASGAHSLNEWFEPLDSHRGPMAAWLLTLAAVGVDGVSRPLLEIME